MKAKTYLSAILMLILVSFLKMQTFAVNDQVIFSTIEGGSIEVKLDNALYPVTSVSSRLWYEGNKIISIDNDLYTDLSVNQSGILKIKTCPLSMHGDTFIVVDTTSDHKKADINLNQMAKIYVISNDNFDSATVYAKDVNRVTGTTLKAKEVTLLIDDTPYDNFNSLIFDDGKSEITVLDGINTYTLKETTTGKLISLKVNGITDTIPPTINSLEIKDGLDTKYALEKDIKVIAEDDNNLPIDAYYFESNVSKSQSVKTDIDNGKLANDLKGITWQANDLYTVYSTGVVTVFVKDNAGNISYRDIEVNKIGYSAPVIAGINLIKDKDSAYIDVNATDSLNQKLFYKLNNGAYTENKRLGNLKDGLNTIYVKNESGVEVSATKEVYLDVYLNKSDLFDKDKLYNYIKVSPVSFTNGTVKVTLDLPDEYINKLDSAAFSINGQNYSASRLFMATDNGEVKYVVKDIYGNTHSLKPYTVTNIDKEVPSVEASIDGETIKIHAKDDLSGIKNVLLSGPGVNNYIVLNLDKEKILEASATYKASLNGSYSVSVTDFAGNVSKASVNITSFLVENTPVSKNGMESKSSTKMDTAKENQATSSRLGTKDKTSPVINRAIAEYDLNYSLAGNKKKYIDPEVKEIEVYRKSDNLYSNMTQMLDVVNLDNTNSTLLKKLTFILLPVLILGSLIGVIVINMAKKR